jgi:hypothetical protein
VVYSTPGKLEASKDSIDERAKKRAFATDPPIIYNGARITEYPGMFPFPSFQTQYLRLESQGIFISQPRLS